MKIKKKRLALKMALSTKFQNDNLVVLNSIELEKIGTNSFVKILQKFNIDYALIVTDKADRKLELSSRNVPGVKVMRHEGLNVYDVLKYRYLVLIEPSIKGIESRLSV